jgi:hypothetical protein
MYQSRVQQQNRKKVEEAILMGGKKKIGPKVHKWHLWECNSTVYLVMEMDKILQV